MPHIIFQFIDCCGKTYCYIEIADRGDWWTNQEAAYFRFQQIFGFSAKDECEDCGDELYHLQEVQEGEIIPEEEDFFPLNK